MAWKYIMLEVRVRGRTGTPFRFPVIFPDKMIHVEMDAVARVLLDGMGLVGKSVSAGKIEHIGVLGLGGDSETLRLESRPEDAQVIEEFAYAHGLDTPLTGMVSQLISESWRKHR